MPKTTLKRARSTVAARKAPIPTETQEQQALIAWWRLYAKTKGLDERLLFAIPNGSNKSIAQAMKFKREGLRSGVPDLMLALPKMVRGFQPQAMQFAGLFVEMKRKGEKGKPNQIAYADLLRRNGYSVVIALGFEEAQRAIRGYLET